MKEHFEHFGWLNFLKSVAATKVFDKPRGGLNSLEAVRAAPAFDVLIFTSEDKLYQESQMLDYELLKP